MAGPCALSQRWSPGGPCCAGPVHLEAHGGQRVLELCWIMVDCVTTGSVGKLCPIQGVSSIKFLVRFAL